MGERRPTGTPEEQQRERDREQHEREQQERVAQQRSADTITTSEGPQPVQPAQTAEQEQPSLPLTPTEHTELGHPGHGRNAEPLQRIRSALASARQAARTVEGGTVALAGILSQIATVERSLDAYLADQEPPPGMAPAQRTQSVLSNQVTNSRGETAEATTREPKAAVEADLHEVKESNKQGT